MEYYSLSDFLGQIRRLISNGKVRISEHGYDELAEDKLTAKEALAGVQRAVVVEEYPDYPKGHSILLLQKDSAGDPVHAVWGIPRGYNSPAILVTAYRPDQKRWNKNFLKRR